MTPFQEYQQQAKQIREEYMLKIAQNPNQEQQLKEELKKLLSKLIDECEAKEHALYKFNKKI